MMSTPAESPVVVPVRSAGRDLPGIPLDTSGSKRLPVLMEMVAGLSRAREPGEVLREFATGFSKLFGLQGYVSLSTRGLAPGQYKITRLIADDVPDLIGRADPWHQWSEIPVHTGGLFGRIIRTAYPQVLQHLDLRDDPVVGDALARYGSMMAIPLFDDGEPLNWAITFGENPEGFPLPELEDAVLRSNLGGATIRNTIMTRQLREAHDALRAEFEQIAKIQRALLPPSLPAVPGLDIGVSYEMFDQAGGDMYAVRALRKTPSSGAQQWDEHGPWGILVADVSGHGPAAAVVMAMMQSIIDTYPREPAGPAEVLAYANHHLSAKRIESRFVTAFLAIYDPATRRLTYSRAGHNPPVWMRPGADGWDMARLDAVGGIPLGIMEEVTYEQATITLEPGQTLVFYTDGVTEAMGPGSRMFGVEGIEGSLTECTGQPACAIEHITSRLREHQAGVRPSDDQTLVVARAQG